MNIELTFNQIKYKKIIKHLKKKYGVPVNTIAKYCGLLDSGMHIWLNRENMFYREENAIKLEQGLEKIIKLVKENEEYKPDL